MRLYSYVNTTYVDADYSTYKAALIADFASGLNNTLANIAISRIWDRSIVNSTFVQINTGESTGAHIEMNSETQPWSLEAWLQYDLYWQHNSGNGNFPMYVSFANEQDVLESFSSQIEAPPLSSITTWMVNGSGLDTFYDYTAGSTPSNVTMNGVVQSFSYPGTSIPGANYVQWQSQLGSPDNFAISFASSVGGGGNNQYCSSNSNPTISDPTIYAVIGRMTTANVSMTNAGDNSSALVGSLNFENNSMGAVEISVYSGLPQTIGQNYGPVNFQLQVMVRNGTAPGTYKILATAPWNGVCPSSSQTSQSSGLIGFRITVIAQLSHKPTNIPPPWWIAYWWVEAIVGMMLLILFLAVIKMRYFDD